MPKHTEPYRILPDFILKAYAKLRHSIRRYGVKHPITLDEHGCILDGHARKAICEARGIECPSTTVRGLPAAPGRRSR